MKVKDCPSLLPAGKIGNAGMPSRTVCREQPRDAGSPTILASSRREAGCDAGRRSEWEKRVEETNGDVMESGAEAPIGSGAPQSRGLARLVSQPPSAPLVHVTIYYLSLGLALVVLFWSFPQLLNYVLLGQEEISALGPGSQGFHLEGAPPASVAQLDTMLRLLVSLVGALALMLPVAWGYMGSRRTAGYDQSVARTTVLLPIAVAGIVIIVQHSLALAFSLAGIVAGVRFRNTLKDTGDALYIFASIGVGLAVGIGALGIAAVVSIFFNYTSLVLWKLDFASEGAVISARKGKKRGGGKGQGQKKAGGESPQGREQ